MSIQEFLDKYNGIGIDYDSAYGNQCMDEFLQYNQDVVHAPRVYGNAKDVWDTYPTAFYDQIPNTPEGIPQCGDVMIWGTGIGLYGHIAIVRDANVNEFTSLDQNWNNVQSCEFITHNYNAVLGWIRPKIFEQKPAQLPEPTPIVVTPPVEVVTPVVNQPVEQPAQVVEVTPMIAQTDPGPTTTASSSSDVIVKIAATTPQAPDIDHNLQISLDKAKQATKFNLFREVKSLLAYIYDRFFSTKIS